MLNNILKSWIVSKNYWPITTQDFIGTVTSEDLKYAVDIDDGEIRFKGIAHNNRWWRWRRVVIQVVLEGLQWWAPSVAFSLLTLSLLGAFRPLSSSILHKLSFNRHNLPLFRLTLDKFSQILFQIFVCFPTASLNSIYGDWLRCMSNSKSQICPPFGILFTTIPVICDGPRTRVIDILIVLLLTNELIEIVKKLIN